MAIFCPAWLFGHLLSPMAAIEWITNLTSHYHRVDRRHVPRIYRHTWLVNAQGKTYPHPNIRHRILPCLAC
jgi:hypothetical protein